MFSCFFGGCFSGVLPSETREKRKRCCYISHKMEFHLLLSCFRPVVGIIHFLNFQTLQSYCASSNLPLQLSLQLVKLLLQHGGEAGARNRQLPRPTRTMQSAQLYSLFAQSRRSDQINLSKLVFFLCHFLRQTCIWSTVSLLTFIEVALSQVSVRYLKTVLAIVATQMWSDSKTPRLKHVDAHVNFPRDPLKQVTLLQHRDDSQQQTETGKQGKQAGVASHRCGTDKSSLNDLSNSIVSFSFGKEFESGSQCCYLLNKTDANRNLGRLCKRISVGDEYALEFSVQQAVWNAWAFTCICIFSCCNVLCCMVPVLHYCS